MDNSSLKNCSMSMRNGDCFVVVLKESLWHRISEGYDSVKFSEVTITQCGDNNDITVSGNMNVTADRSLCRG